MTVKQSISALLEGESMGTPVGVAPKPVTLKSGKESFSLIFGVTPEGKPSLSAKADNGDRVSVSILVEPGFTGSVLGLATSSASFLREPGVGSNIQVRQYTNTETGEVINYRTFIVDTTAPQLPEGSVGEEW